MAQLQPLSQTPVDRVAATPALFRDSIGTCRHQAALEAAVPDTALLDAEAPTSAAQRTICPTCDCPLELRFLRPAAGGCMLWIEERWLAGRKWAYRRVGDRWDAST